MRVEGTKMKRIATDRSRIETYQHCRRQRWYEYHQDGVGIVPVKKALALAVGGAVHKGLETLLRGSAAVNWAALEENAVAAALADFASFKGGNLDIGGEVIARPPSDGSGDVDEAQVAAASVVPAPYDDYLYREQSALVEALVRAYARRRLRPLLEEFEVLEVEREGEWKLADLVTTHRLSGRDVEIDAWGEVVFLSRPDALLRSRADNSLVLLSFKTTGQWDDRKRRDAEHDMQGLSEGIEIERRLGEWYEYVTQNPQHWQRKWDQIIPPATFSYLNGCTAPPRILAIRYEYLLKGERWKDKDLAARYSIDWARSQRSHLIRPHVCVSTPSRGANAGAFQIGDLCWSSEFHMEDGRASKLAWQNWDGRLVTDLDMTVREWIDKLDTAVETLSPADSTLGTEPSPLGWSSDAQAVGYTPKHPLDAVFLPPMTVYRNDDDLRDLIEQMEAQETTVAEHVAAVETSTSEDERRSLLNRHFPQTRRACEYPSTCAYVRVCYGGEDIRREPLGSGLFRLREANHPREKEFRE
jgi:hypothetical protein